MAWDDIFAKCFTAVNSVISLSSGIAIGMGFGLKGIALGSAAASIQSGIGNVVAGSMFATMTSLGMTAVLSTLCIGCGVLALVLAVVRAVFGAILAVVLHGSLLLS